jgi:hypothetical protein
MGKIFRIGFIILFTVMSVKAAAEEGTCVLEASNKDVFVIVFDADDEGNKGPQIWQGRINQGESAKITAPHAHIRYSYNDQPEGDGPDRKNFTGLGKRTYDFVLSSGCRSSQNPKYSPGQEKESGK